MSNDSNLNREIEEGLARADEMLRREKRRQWLYAFLGLFALVCAFLLGFLIRPTNSAAAADNLLYFSSNRSGKYEIYYRGVDGKSVQITHTSQGESWGPVLGPTGILYFVSNESGQPEIYIKTSGNSMRLINSGGKYGSWDPKPVSGGALYFVSNRSGKNEIYYRTEAGFTMQVTSTAGGQTQFSVP